MLTTDERRDLARAYAEGAHIQAESMRAAKAANQGQHVGPWQGRQSEIACTTPNMVSRHGAVSYDSKQDVSVSCALCTMQGRG